MRHTVFVLNLTSIFSVSFGVKALKASCTVGFRAWNFIYRFLKDFLANRNKIFLFRKYCDITKLMHLLISGSEPFYFRFFFSCSRLYNKKTRIRIYFFPQPIAVQNWICFWSNESETGSSQSQIGSEDLNFSDLCTAFDPLTDEEEKNTKKYWTENFTMRTSFLHPLKDRVGLLTTMNEVLCIYMHMPSIYKLFIPHKCHHVRPAFWNVSERPESCSKKHRPMQKGENAQKSWVENPQNICLKTGGADIGLY